MCELLAMSTQPSANLTLSLQVLVEHSGGSGPADGWGVAYYEGHDARRIRDTSAAADSPWSKFVGQQGLTSQLVLAHIRRATQGATSLSNTQPFCRELGGRIHTFAHNGDLPGLLESGCIRSRNFRPVGDSDSEHAFCVLLERLRERWLDPQSQPSFEYRWRVFQEFCAELRPLGPANLLYSDSEYLFVHGNRRTQSDGERRPPGLYWLCRECAQDGKTELSSAALSVRTDLQHVVLIASVPLTDEPWQALAEGETLAVRRGRIAARAVPDEAAAAG